LEYPYFGVKQHPDKKGEGNMGSYGERERERERERKRQRE